MDSEFKEVLVSQGKMEQELKNLGERFTEFKSDFKTMREEKNAEFSNVWKAIDKQRTNVNKLLWKIFSIVTIPLVILIITSIMEALKKG